MKRRAIIEWDMEAGQLNIFPDQGVTNLELLGVMEAAKFMILTPQQQQPQPPYPQQQPTAQQVSQERNEKKHGPKPLQKNDRNRPRS